MNKSPRMTQACAAVGRMLDIACLKAKKDDEVTVFDAKDEVPVGMGDYLARWVKHTKNDALVLVPAMVLLDRAISRSGLSLTNRRKHRLVLAALVITQKISFDINHSNVIYSRIGGVTLEEVTRLEREFLRIIDWDCSVSAEEYDEYVTALGC
eukprot:TRINITY_DN9061_c2_g1_i2.p1 TRINITY_DN9061_c2_g1~~TRINITY_DN9061_c2_g1_i2.p1  ORF type:complete len:169 (+),score=38.40 TRINITY_DN9061_c2_g1_i2:49-507(+)